LRLAEGALAPIENQSQLAQVGGRPQSPANGLTPGFLIAADLIVEGLSEAHLGHGSFARHERFKLLPASGAAVSLAPQEPQALRP